MASYYRKRLSLVFSNNSDYSDPLLYPPLEEYTSATPTKAVAMTVSAATTGTTVELGYFSAVQSIAIINTDSTNYVEAVWVYTNGSGSDTTNKQKIVPGGSLSFDGTMKTSSDLVLTADTASCTCSVYIVGT